MTLNGMPKAVWRIIAVGSAIIVLTLGTGLVRAFHSEQKLHCANLANHEQRLATIEANYRHIAKALDRIEKKLERRN